MNTYSFWVYFYILDSCGFAPFAGESDFDTLQLVASAPLEFPSPEWDDISNEATDFVARLLNRNSDQRPTAEEAMRHPWIAKHIVPPGIPKPLPFKKRSVSERDRSSLRLDSEKVTAFNKFLANIKVKKALNSVAEVVTPSEARFLGRIFRKVDKDKDGKIYVSDIDHAVETGSFSSLVKGNLLQMRSIMDSTTRTASSFDIMPFLDAVSSSEGEKDMST